MVQCKPVILRSSSDRPWFAYICGPLFVLRQGEISRYLQDPSSTKTLILAEQMFTAIPNKRKEHVCDENLIQTWLAYGCLIQVGVTCVVDSGLRKRPSAETSVAQVEGSCTVGGPTFRKNYEGYKLFIIQIHNMFFLREKEREQEIYFLTSWIFNLCTHKMQKHGYMYACHTLMVCCHLYCHASGSSTSSFFLMKYNFNLVSLTFDMPWVYDWNLYPEHFELFFSVFREPVSIIQNNSA